ncbi:DUF2637 domain-containing protein [Streptomyces sp. NBC_01201]|uniref:DUF2637 domain-containing protein n=1 Tax=unclassified Streptomyces TaxID=2593676 RepID=UPI002E128101|nr:MULTISPECIES: DUF2637 domain-containing protein [unclassified Streptomyces]WSR09421.1 DUF2637 domain-containing protein [Streptomyces sp. NBC_01208]WSR47851.1 DUF2637 domain-containing protein [Streptomyces sp. NBC_01201]
MTRPSPVTGLAIGAAVTTVALTAAAFWLSYEHLHDIAEENGLDGARAWAWPATVDLFIVAGELLMLRASLRGRRMDWWAVALAATGSVGSIALNVAGVGEHADPMRYVVAAVPPTAALLAFGAIMRQIHERLAPPVAPEPAPAVATLQRIAENVVPEGATQLPIVPATPRVALPPATPQRPAQRPVTPPDDAALQQVIDDAMAPVAADLTGVELMTVADVAKLKGVAEGTVRSWVSRRKLQPALRDANGRHHFHPAAVAEID